MALTPSNPQTEAEKRAQRDSSQQDALLREVDEAVRQDQFTNFAIKYGKPIVGAVVLGLAAFGGWLWWYESREGDNEKSSEELVQAIDNLEAGNFTTASQALLRLEKEGDVGAVTVAKLSRAAVAVQQAATLQNDPTAQKARIADAEKLYAEVAADTSAPKPYRDYAAIREVSLRYEKMKPAHVVERMKPLAKPGTAFFGSAGELLGAAYLDQGKNDLAGPLFAEIAKDETVPDSLRSRARQLAGLLGVDAIDDVDKTLKEMRAQGEVAQEAE